MGDEFRVSAGTQLIRCSEHGIGTDPRGGEFLKLEHDSSQADVMAITEHAQTD